MQLKMQFLAAVLLLSICTHAQFKKGDRMAGSSVGSVLFNSGSSDITVVSIGSNTSKITSYDVRIIPSLGWFVSDNTVVEKKPSVFSPTPKVVRRVTLTPFTWATE